MPNNSEIADHVLLTSLFAAFLQVSLLGFGGGLVWAHRIVVEQRQWATEDEFADILSLCQFMPGPNVVGIGVCVGAKLRGAIGTIAAVAGFVLLPCLVGFCLGLLYLKYAHFAVFRNILGGVSAVAAGMLMATGIRMLVPFRHRPVALIIAALAFGGMAFTRLPLLAVLFGAALLGLAAARIEAARVQ